MEDIDPEEGNALDTDPVDMVSVGMFGVVLQVFVKLVVYSQVVADDCSCSCFAGQVVQVGQEVGHVGEVSLEVAEAKVAKNAYFENYLQDWLGTLNFCEALVDIAVTPELCLCFDILGLFV